MNNNQLTFHRPIEVGNRGGDGGTVIWISLRGGNKIDFMCGLGPRGDKNEGIWRGCVGSYG